MDKATVIGIFSGLLFIIMAIVTQDSILTFWSLSSFLIVIGGITAATLINYSFDQVLSVLKVVKIAFVGEQTKNLEVINSMVNMAEKARREGLLALDEIAADSEDPFLTEGIMLIVDGTKPEFIRSVLETEIDMMELRHKVGAGIFETMGASAPAFGMIGTLIGLVLMLTRLNDPGSLGPGMALALITTFYGSVMANLIFLPIAGKLKLRSHQEIIKKEIILEGIIAIQAGDNPRLVAEKMKAYLDPEERHLIDKMRIEEKRRLYGGEEVETGL